MVSKNILWILVAFIAGLAVGYFLPMLVQQGGEQYVQKIKQRGVLIMGTSADWPPFEYVDKAGNVVGIDAEIAKRIAQELGVRLEVKDMKFAALIEALKGGQVDIVLADMTPTAERGKQVDFSIPYYFSKGNAVIVLESRLGEFKGINDFHGKKVGVQLGTIQEEWANDNLGGKAEVIPYDRVYPEMVMALQRGDIDAIIVGDIMADAVMHKVSGLELAFYAGGTRIGAAVAVPKGADDLLYVVNSVIENMLESGEMEALLQTEVSKWLEAGG
ncbi:MAG: ABC transporter substrate-binding protein [Thermofilaceae archaeon]